MDGYYRDSFDRRRGRGAEEKERKSVWVTIIDMAAAIISITAAAGLTLIFTGQFVSPDRFWYFSLSALAAPAVYITAVACMLYWIIRWKWIPALVLALFAAGGLVYVPLYYKIRVAKTYTADEGGKGSIKVLTFNLRHMYQDNWMPSFDSVAQIVAQQRPDILCFQEFPASGEFRRKAEEIFSGYRYASATVISPNSDCALKCYSRYETVDSDTVEGMKGTGSGLWMDVKTGDDTVRVYNVHLQTTSVLPRDNKYISNLEFIGDTTSESRFRHMAHGLLENNKMRAQQAECIARELDGCRHPVILCGDFNDVPLSYAYRTATKGLYDTFSRKGYHYAHSYRGMFGLLRIDYIMVSPQFETKAYGIPHTEISDHYPVTATVKLKDKKQK